MQHSYWYEADVQIEDHDQTDENASGPHSAVIMGTVEAQSDGPESPMAQHHQSQQTR